MTLAQWDEEIRPHLNFIEAGAEMAARHASMLPMKPSFETRSETELAEARGVLERALAKIKAAQVAYNSKQSECA